MTMLQSRELLNATHDIYLHLDKRFGAVSPEAMLDIGLTLNRTAPDIVLPNDCAIAGSSLIEAALFYEDETDDLLDVRIDYIDDAMNYFAYARDMEYGFLEKGFREPDDQENWLRLEMQLAFKNVYKDLIVGDITNDTREEVIQELTRLALYARNHAMGTLNRHGHRSSLLGLANEITRILSIWTVHDPRAIAIPSTVRGGEGNYNSKDTHDAIIVRLDEFGKITSIDPREYKRGKLKIMQNAGRYGARIERGPADTLLGNDQKLRHMGREALIAS